MSRWWTVAARQFNVISAIGAAFRSGIPRSRAARPEVNNRKSLFSNMAAVPTNPFRQLFPIQGTMCPSSTVAYRVIVKGKQPTRFRNNSLDTVESLMRKLKSNQNLPETITINYAWERNIDQQIDHYKGVGVGMRVGGGVGG